MKKWTILTTALVTAFTLTACGKKETAKLRLNVTVPSFNLVGTVEGSTTKGAKIAYSLGDRKYTPVNVSKKGKFHFGVVQGSSKTTLSVKSTKNGKTTKTIKTLSARTPITSYKELQSKFNVDMPQLGTVSRMDPTVKEGLNKVTDNKYITTKVNVDNRGKVLWVWVEAKSANRKAQQEQIAVSSDTAIILNFPPANFSELYKKVLEGHSAKASEQNKNNVTASFANTNEYYSTEFYKK